MSGGEVVKFLLAGGVIGFISGILGIGGGVLVIPVLVFVFHFSQEKAVGTSLAMLLPPIGIFAVMKYWQAKQVDVPGAAVLAASFAIGAWAGALAVTSGKIHDEAMRRAFAFFLLYVAGNILFRKDPKAWAVLRTLWLIGAAAIAYGALRAVGRHWERRFSLAAEYRRGLEAPASPDYEI